MSEKTEVPVATLEYEHTAFEQALLKHKSKIILVGVLAVVGTLGYWGWRLVKESKHHSASVDFTRAGTVEELKKVATEHAGQPSAGDALILAADKLFTENKGPDAISTLKDFLSKNPEHPLRDLASWRMAEYLAAGGDTVAAEKEYEALGQGNSPFTGFSLLRLGDLKWGAGDKDKAQEYYDKILRNPSMAGNPARADAQDRMDKGLKLKPPTPVEYVAPLLPPAKLGAGNGEAMGPGNMGLPADFKLPEGLSLDEDIPFTPPVPGGKPLNSPGLLDDVPAIPPPAPPQVPPPAPPVENKDNKGTTDPAKPATAGQP